MLVIPYRVKNPITKIPFVTITILLANVILYAMNTKDFLHIRGDVYNEWAFALGYTPLWKFFLSIFIHSDLLQLGMNSLFLFVLGPAVEERLGRIRYVIVYLLAGMVGAVFQAGMDLAYTGSLYVWIGSSSCVMGIVGAYWYVYSWSKINVFYWFVTWYGTWEVDAFWVVGFYLVLDLVQGMVYHQVGFKGGITNLSHVAAAASAVLFCIALRVRRDSEALSEAKAMRADEVNLANLPLHALQTMLDENPKDIEILAAMIVPAIRENEREALAKAFVKVGTHAIEKDPRLVAHYLIDFRSDPRIYKATHLLHLAGLLERMGETMRAMTIYRLIVDRFTEDKDAETAIYRMAVVSWNTLKDASAARTYIDEMQWRYPHGDMIEFARTLARKLPLQESPEVAE
jgi:membrane associated rhomboid family serine protease